MAEGSGQFMQVVPVIDLLGGIVVRGIGGRRDEYRPIESRLVDSCHPVDVAHAFRDRFGFTSLYVADLDAILKGQPNTTIIENLIDDGFRLLVDAGIANRHAAQKLGDLGCEVVVGLESLQSPDDARSIVESQPLATFSLDLRNGIPMLGEHCRNWSHLPFEIAQTAVDFGYKRIIVLDLADVGMNCGTRTTLLAESLRRAFPSLHLTVGGGVRNSGDLTKWRQLGANAILVASALHDGGIDRSDLCK